MAGIQTKLNKFTEAMENLTLVEAYYNRSPDARDVIGSC
ncbi:hypothetical protein [Klebsiella pneumoniae IS43]|jgi:hypothetical protein|uniref:Uncharacterized protein n=2 Tax=Klebsiella pneumoniae TaxID=573 RepID=W1DRK2_KLEPN|nr:hypothetical protein [Klebsiella pneumoniae IS43]